MNQECRAGAPRRRQRQSRETREGDTRLLFSQEGAPEVPHCKRPSSPPSTAAQGVGCSDCFVLLFVPCVSGDRSSLFSWRGLPVSAETPRNLAPPSRTATGLGDTCWLRIKNPNSTILSITPTLTVMGLGEMEGEAISHEELILETGRRVPDQLDVSVLQSCERNVGRF